MPSPVQNSIPSPTTATPPVLKTSPDLMYNQQNWPSIQNNRGVSVASNTKKISNKNVQNNSSNKVFKNSLNNIKNIKNSQCIVNKNVEKTEEKGQNGGGSVPINKSMPILNNINVYGSQVIHNNNDQSVMYTSTLL